jgi:hypothetical protein
MANINVRIKRKGASNWDSLFPETTVDQLKADTSGTALSTFTTNILGASNPSAVSFIKVGTNGSITFRTAAETRSDIGAAPTSHNHTQAQVTNLVSDLDDKADLTTSGLIQSSQVPDYLFSGLKFAGTTAGGSSEDTLEELLSLANTALGSTTNQQREGAYFVVTTSFTLTHANSGHRLLVGDEGDADASVDLEAGDWVVYIGYGDQNSAGSDRHEWAIINNTYRNAEVNVSGVVALSGGTTTTRAGLSSTSSGLKAMDEKAVRTVMKHIFYESSESNASTALFGDLLFEGTY